MKKKKKPTPFTSSGKLSAVTEVTEASLAVGPHDFMFSHATAIPFT